jgi:hypothetical protein
MKSILIVPRARYRIGYELGECMASLQNAGIRDYSAHLERYIIFWIADRSFPGAVKVLVRAGFEVVFGTAAEASVDDEFKVESSAENRSKY